VLTKKIWKIAQRGRFPPLFCVPSFPPFLTTSTESITIYGDYERGIKNFSEIKFPFEFLRLSKIFLSNPFSSTLFTENYTKEGEQKTFKF